VIHDLARYEESVTLGIPITVLPFDIEEYPAPNLAGSYTNTCNLTGWPAAVVASVVAKYLETSLGGWKPPSIWRALS
jgi:hypothetical protein